MICKECGAKLSVRDATCPRCGAVVPASEGGVGFWDMLDGPVSVVKPADSSQPVTKPDRLDQQSKDGAGEEPEMKLMNEKASLPIVVCCALSTACLLGTLVSGFLAMSSANATRADLQKEISALKEEVDKLRDTVDDVRNTQSSMQLELVKSPSNTTKAEGLDDDSVLFELQVAGRVKSFTWQKMQNDTGGWEELYFDEDGINAQYGLKLVQDVETGTTALQAAGLASNSSGTYRCMVRGIYGDELSPTATLTVLPESEADIDAIEEDYDAEANVDELTEEGTEDTGATADTEDTATDEVAPGTPVGLDDLGEAGAEGDVVE